MSESKPNCSECQSESEHAFKLKIAQLDQKIVKETGLLYKTPDGHDGDFVPISLSDYSDSDSENDKDTSLCRYLNTVSNEDRELFKLPPEYVIGEAIVDGSCFFDSFKQGLQALGHTSISITELRSICARVADKSPLWLVNSLPKGTLRQFTARTLLVDSWGDTELHGRILCEYFNVDLYVLEGHAGFGVIRSLVSGNGIRCINSVPFGRPGSIYLINRGRNHFEPLLRIGREFKEVLEAIKTSDEPRLKAALVNHRRVLYYSQVERQLEQYSLREAIFSFDIRILDLLYEHWSGTAFGAHSPHFHNLQHLGCALVKARDSCQPELKRDQQMLIDVHCIIEFNKFEVELYRQLHDYPVSNAKNRKQRLLRMIDILTTTIELYEIYSDKNIRATKNEVADILLLQPLYNDKSSIYQKYIHYALYEVYYRKLDFCISKVILEYVHSLKEKLELPKDAYQNIECTLYYFLHRTNEEWRLYVPENRPKGKRHACFNDNDFCHVVDDEFRLFSGPVIYLEWLKFRKSLRNFKEVLASTSVPDNYREKGKVLPKEEVNSLTLLPYLRDEHSLRRVVNYLEGAEYAIQRLSPVDAALVVQRALQVTGECLKSSDKSLHLSSITRAILQVYIPVSTVEHLNTLRDDLSKVREGKFIRRVNIEETNPDLFLEVAKDVEWIKKAIIEVLAVYKPMVEKYLLGEGLDLVRARIKEFSSTFSLYGSAVREIQRYLAYGGNLYINLENQMIKSISEFSGVNITRQFARELGYLYRNIEVLRSEIYQRDVQIISYVQTLLQPVYSNLQNIEKQINEWTSLKPELEQLQLQVLLTDYCNETLKLIIDEVKLIKCKTQKQILRKLSSIKNYAPEWSLIKSILQYIIVTMDLFRNNHYEIKHSSFTNKLNSISNGHPNATGVTEVKYLLAFIEHEIKNHWKITQLPIPKDLSAYRYEAIKQLKVIMSKKKFITNKEMQYLKDKLHKTDVTHPIMEKILSGEEITLRERAKMYTDIGSLNERCKAIVENLVIGSKRDECALQCLAQRARLLKQSINDDDFPRLVQKYNQDDSFRILTECLLNDIHIVHHERGLKNLLDDNMRMLAEFPMRNILCHGNPLLEVIGKMLDSTDFPATLFRFALRVVEDESGLTELARLYEQGVKREQAEREWDGPRTPRLQHYFKLLPSETSYNHIQNNLRKDTNDSDNSLVLVDSNVTDNHIITNYKTISKIKVQDKNKSAKDRNIMIKLNDTMYCIQYSKDEEKKARSFMNRILKKKQDSLKSKARRNQQNHETGNNVDIRSNPKNEIKLNVRESDSEGTFKTGAAEEVIKEKMTKLCKTDTSTKPENTASIQQEPTRGTSNQKLIIYSNNESPVIKVRKREVGDIRIKKYFMVIGTVIQDVPTTTIQADRVKF